MTTEAPPHTRPSREELEREPTDWLSWYLRPYFCDARGTPVAMAPHHAEFWQWAWQIDRGRPPVIAGKEREGIVSVWPREGAKSTTAEAAVTSLAARRKRKYALYVCHESGTLVFDRTLGWLTVDEHPTAMARDGMGFEVQVKGLPTSEVVTPEHRYWTRKMPRVDLGHGRGCVYDRGEPGWAEARNIGTNTWLGLPIDDTETMPAKWPDPLLADPAFWWAVGLWWGDGTLGGPRRSQISWSMSDGHPDHDAQLRQVLAAANLKIGSRRGAGRSSDVYVWRPALAAWLRTWSTENSRKQPPTWVEELPLPYQAALLRGYFDADGYVTPTRGSTLTSIHLPGLLAVRRMLARLGTVGIVNGPYLKGGGSFGGRVMTPATAYVLGLSDGRALGLPCSAGTPNEFRDVWIGEGHLWSRLRSIEPVADRTFVAIQTASEDYLTDFARSHNCSQQTQADDHVQNIGDMMTGERIAEDYPELADRAVGTYGPRAWRRNRLMSAIGFTIDALGLDTAMRGVKLGRERPDLIILDDIDDVTDSAYLTGQKRLRITRSLLPAGSGDTMVIAIQNLILRGGIFDRLVHGTAGFLQNAIVQGPIPALRDCVIEKVDGKDRIISGTPTWPGGQPIEVCQRYIDRYGLEAFLAECQHQVLLLSGLIHGKFSPGVHRWPEELSYPRFMRVVGGLDHGSEGETAHPTAGLVGGVMGDGRVLLLAEFKERGQDIAVRLQTWMREQENRWRGPGSIQWASDGTEHLGNQLLRANGFNVTPSKMGGRDEASREGRVRAVGRRLALDGRGRPGLMYVAELRDFVDEIESYKRAQPRFEGDRTQPHILRTNDDEMSALEYLIELLDQHAPLPDPERPSVGEVLW